MAEIPRRRIQLLVGNEKICAIFTPTCRPNWGQTTFTDPPHRCSPVSPSAPRPLPHTPCALLFAPCPMLSAPYPCTLLFAPCAMLSASSIRNPQSKIRNRKIPTLTRLPFDGLWPRVSRGELVEGHIPNLPICYPAEASQVLYRKPHIDILVIYVT